MRKPTRVGRVTKNIAQRIRRLREERELTAADLARDLGFSRSYWTAIENGKHPIDAEMLCAIAERLDVTMVDLLFDSEGYEPGTKFANAVFGTYFTDAWSDPEFKRLVTSIAKARQTKESRWVFEACRRIVCL